jgi:hypothetical protein
VLQRVSARHGLPLFTLFTCITEAAADEKKNKKKAKKAAKAQEDAKKGKLTFHIKEIDSTLNAITHSTVNSQRGQGTRAADRQRRRLVRYTALECL